MGAPSPRCEAEFKQEAAELYGKSGTAYAEVARGPGRDAGACPAGSRRPTRPIAGGRRPVPDGRGPAQAQRRRPQHGAVRRHRLREDPAGPAVPDAGDGHMVEADSGLGHGPGHHRRARRRDPEDGPDQEKQPERMHTSLGLQSPVRVAAAVQDRARARRAPVHGLDILAVGQRGHGVAHGHREVGVRARATRPRWTSSSTSRRCATGRGSTRRRAT